MKKFVKIFSIIITLILSATVVLACGGKTEKPEDKNIEEVGQTGTLFVSGFESDYKLVVPEERGRYLDSAIAEFNYFMNLAYGIILDTVADSAAAGTKFISLGATANFSQQTAIEYDKKLLGSDGYIIKTVGDNVYIIGGGDEGTLYGVYKFFEYTSGLRVYADDEIVISKSADAALKDFNIRDIPDIAVRALGMDGPGNLAYYANRMRIMEQRNGPSVWALWSHTHFRILPFDKYYPDHHDWYTSSVKSEAQLCLTRDVGDLDTPNDSTDNMRYHFVENLQAILEANPTARFVMLGQEDSASFCSCDDCKAEIAKYGTASAINMRFTNAIARDMKDWLAEQGREIIFATFAYQDTLAPPVIYDGVNDTYKPAHPSVVADDNVMVMYAPIRASYSASIMDEQKNGASREALRGWSAVSGKLAIWSYAVNFHDYLIPYDNFGVMASNYKVFEDFGVEYLYDQGSSGTTIDTFNEMRVYVQSRLMWDNSLNTQALIKDFINNFYKDAAPMVQEYYDIVQTRFLDYRYEQQLIGRTFETHVYTHLMSGVKSADLWQRNVLNRLDDLIARAYAAVSKNPDAEVREKLIQRLQELELSPLYIQIEVHGNAYDDLQERVDRFISLADSLGMIRYGEGDRFLSAKYQDWQLKLK